MDLSSGNKSTLLNQIESVSGELERASNIVVRLRSVASRKAEQIESTSFEVGEAICRIPDDHISIRSWKLAAARDVLATLLTSLGVSKP
jgi:hypothetical protein